MVLHRQDSNSLISVSMALLHIKSALEHMDCHALSDEDRQNLSHPSHQGVQRNEPAAEGRRHLGAYLPDLSACLRRWWHVHYIYTAHQQRATCRSLWEVLPYYTPSLRRQMLQRLPGPPIQHMTIVMQKVCLKSRNIWSAVYGHPSLRSSDALRAWGYLKRTSWTSSSTIWLNLETSDNIIPEEQTGMLVRDAMRYKCQRMFGRPLVPARLHDALFWMKSTVLDSDVSTISLPLQKWILQEQDDLLEQNCHCYCKAGASKHRSGRKADSRSVLC